MNRSPTSNAHVSVDMASPPEWSGVTSDVPFGRARPSEKAGRARRRLGELKAMGALRSANGTRNQNLEKTLRVIINAIACAANDGRRLDEETVRKYIPAIDQEAISSEKIVAAISAAVSTGGLIRDHDAGRMLGLTEAERVTLLYEHGVLLTMHPIDEDDASRNLRRDERRRAGGRDRVKRHRLAKKAGVAKDDALRDVANIAEHVTLNISKDIYNKYGGVTREYCTEQDRVAAAIAAGASSPAEIEALLGISLTTIRPLLSRLKKEGRVVSRAWGRYAIAQSEASSARPAVGYHQASITLGTAIRDLTSRVPPAANASAALAVQVTTSTHSAAVRVRDAIGKEMKQHGK